MNTELEPLSFDLLVAGGGLSGVCAAVASARKGMRTLLVEREGYLGGIGFAGKLHQICGLYLNSNSYPECTLNGGLAEEIADLLTGNTHYSRIQQIGQLYVLPYETTDLLKVIDAVVAAEANLTVIRNGIVTGVETADGAVTYANIEVSGVARSVAADVFIDATGTGDIAVMAGADYELASAEDRQLSGFVIRVTGLQGTDDVLPIKIAYCCARGVDRSVLHPLLKFTSFSFGAIPGEGFLKISMPCDNGLNRDAEALENANCLIEYLRNSLLPFSEAQIAETSLKVVDREGRRIVGDYILSECDVLSARKFPDAIVKNVWPIELWSSSTGTRYSYLPRGDYYEIPFRCITVKGIANLLTAGRCISVSHGALGSTRVMGVCMTLGEQAGVAAAHRIKHGIFPFGTAGNR